MSGVGFTPGPHRPQPSEESREALQAAPGPAGSMEVLCVQGALCNSVQSSAGRGERGPLPHPSPTIRPHKHLQPALSRWVQQPQEGCEDSSRGATAGSRELEASKP